MFGVGLVVGEVQRERIGEQSGVQTHLPRGRVLRAEILDRSGGARGPRTLLPFVGQVGDAPKNRAAHFGPRSPHLEIVDERGELHHFVNQSRKADRGEAVRQVVRVGRIRMPFVADRGREVEHAPPSGLHAGEYGLLLLAFALLKPLARCAVGVGVGQREEVGQFERTARSGDAGELVGDAGADIGEERELLPVLVYGGDEVAVAVGVLLFGEFEESVVAAGEQRVGRCVELARRFADAQVGFGAAGEGEPVGHLVGEARVHHGAPPLVVLDVAVHHPQGVLHVERAAAPRPVLHVAFFVRIIDLEHHQILDAFAARVGVERGQRVEIASCREHVLVFGLHVAEACIQRHPILQERGRVANRDGVFVV